MRERGMMPITLTRSGREKGGESFRKCSIAWAPSP